MAKEEKVKYKNYVSYTTSYLRNIRIMVWDSRQHKILSLFFCARAVSLGKPITTNIGHDFQARHQYNNK